MGSLRSALHQFKPSSMRVMSRSVIFACLAQFGDFVSHLGRASAQVARDLFYRQLAREHVTEVKEVDLGPARPGIHPRPIERGILARELTPRVMH